MAFTSGQVVNAADLNDLDITTLTTSGTVTIGGFTLPAIDGSADQVLVTNGLGTVTWQDQSGGGTPGGSNGHIQYNNNGAFAGSTAMTFDGGTTNPIFTVEHTADSGVAEIRVQGTGQGTGALFAGQSNAYGGGVFYNGDGNPSYATGESQDRISFFRRSAGTNEVVFDYPYNSNTVTFRGDVSVAGSTTITGDSTATRYYSTSNGAGTNYRLGDDCWIGDVNVANTTRLTGVQNSDRAYLQFGNSGQTLGQVGSGSLDWTGNFYASGWIQAGGNMYLRSGNGVHDSIYRVGGIFFTWDSDSYGTNTHHSIRSTNGDSWGDHITINSFGNVRVNIDSNGNGSNTFTIGRHTTGTSNTLLYLDESANLEVYGGRLATSKNSTGNVGNASLNLGLGQGSGVIAAWNVYNYAPLITIGSGEIFYIRNYLNSSYAWLYGYINNVSSKHHKTNIRTLGEPTASVGSAGTTFNAMEKVRQLRPVTYHLYERDALPRMPKNEDGTTNQRRIDAINRLDKIRKKNGLGHFERDDLKHICGRDCEGDIQNPCFHYKNWAKGKIGFIAQEVGEVLNEVADFSEERPDEHESIDSLGLIAICVKALQEIDNRLAQLEAS